MNSKLSLNVRAGLLSLLILAVLLGIWHVATMPAAPAGGPVANDEYAKLMGKSSAVAKSDGLPTLSQMGETVV